MPADAEFARSWFATIDGTTLGPLSPAQVHVLVERGWIRAETLIRHERMVRAVPAACVHGLPPLRRSPPRLRCVAPEPDQGLGVRDLILFLAGAATALAAALAIVA